MGRQMKSLKKSLSVCVIAAALASAPAATPAYAGVLPTTSTSTLGAAPGWAVGGAFAVSLSLILCSQYVANKYHRELTTQEVAQFSLVPFSCFFTL